MSDSIRKKAISDRDWWRQFERGNWILYGFTERDSASFRNTKTNRTVQVTGDYLDLLANNEA